MTVRLLDEDYVRSCVAIAAMDLREKRRAIRVIAG